ncbi:DUF6213 family protein [Streptomyces sp. NPDC051563]|uniref:DUF6213 family protein n=1 Tax=Streptomyces sp. NPDC051563 TaxID=3365659 RepID=UPI0037A9500B
MIQMSIPLIPAEDGKLLVPAGHVTCLLRRLAADWLEPVRTGDARADEQTIEDLAGVLTELADQIDVECIGYTSTAPHS